MHTNEIAARAESVWRVKPYCVCVCVFLTGLPDMGPFVADG